MLPRPNSIQTEELEELLDIVILNLSMNWLLDTELELNGAKRDASDVLPIG